MPDLKTSDIPALAQRQSAIERRMDVFETELKEVTSAMNRGFSDVLNKLEAREQRHGGEVKGELAELKGDLRSESEERKRLEGVVQARGRTHWPTVLTALGMVGAVIVAAQKFNSDSVDSKVALAAKDIQISGLTISRDLSTTRRDVDTLMAEAGKTDLLGEKFRGVEDQLSHLEDTTDGERADNDRFVRMLWEKVMGQQLPAKNVYHRGPTKPVSINAGSTLEGRR